MARKPNPTKESLVETQPAETIEAIRADLQAADNYPVAVAAIEENAVALANELSYDGALTVESLEEEIKFYQRRSVEAVLEMGKRLLLLKEISGHGGFLESLDRLSIEKRLAQRLMDSTRRFSKAASTPLLSLPNLNRTKLLELLVLDDGEIEALNSGDEIRGITLDDVDCMSVSELRRALRKEKADKEAEVAQAKASVSGELASKDKLIADKSALIAKLVDEKNRREHLTEDEAHTELEYQLTAKTLIAVGALAPVRQVVHNIRSLEQCPQGTYVAMQGALDRVIAEAMAIASDYGIQLNLNTWSDDLDALDNPNRGEVVDAIFPAAAE